jgi:hypothetical protein
MKYDENGNQAELAYYGAGGLLEFRWTHKYDANRREIERARYDATDSLEFKEVMTRNEQGNVIETLTYNRGGGLTRKVTSTFEYDSRGNWVKNLDFECSVEAGSDSCKPYRVDYRFITYYRKPGPE